MNVLRLPLALIGGLRDRLAGARYARRLDRWRARGMHIGRDVNIPECLHIDEDYCALIRIEDSTSFGPECMMLAHDAGRVGTVVLRPSCHIGARSIVLPGVEVGPRTVVAANSIVSRSFVGGRSAELSRTGGSARTPLEGYAPTPPEPLPEDEHLS
jgi:acetyltransferase-like isoleucine patch superfamily enzyme